MIIKTDKYIRRWARVWDRWNANDEKVAELVRRETWWLLWWPLYSRDTIIDKWNNKI